MKRIMLTLIVLTTSTAAHAGCIGPTIMGECQGQIVQWDTHPQGPSGTPPALSGMPYDKRGTDAEQQNPGSVNQFTGRDAHDPDLDAERRMRCRNAAMQRGILINCP